MFRFKHWAGLSNSFVWLALGIGAVLGLFGTNLLVKNAGDSRIKK